MPLLAEAFIGSPGSRLLIAVLAALAAASLVGALAVVFGRSQARVERRIAGYERIEAASTPVGSRDVGLVETGVVQQAVALTESIAVRTGFLVRTERLLEQADLPLRAAEMLFYLPAFTLMAALLTAIAFSATAALLVAVVAGLGPIVYVKFRSSRRLREFERQLPDTLTLLAGAMRAGFSFLQGLETVADETTDPMQRELQRCFTEARLGRSLEDALEDVSIRMESRDLGWAVMAIRIQREVGGNLASLLDTIADTMTKRERLRREIRSLTAEGRLSGVVLSLFPPAFAGLLFLLQPEYIEKLFDDSVGIAAAVLAGFFSVVGWLWLRKIVDIEV